MLEGLSGEDWRNIFLAIIAATTTIITTLGPLLLAKWRAVDKTERAQVASVNAQTSSTIATIHEITNGRFEAMRDELRKSNEQVVHLLQKLAADPERATSIDFPSSTFVAAPIPKPPE